MNFLQKPSQTWQKFRGFISRPTHSRTMGLVIILVLVAAVSLTVYVAQQQQSIKQRASAVCEDTSIQECPDSVKEKGNDCAANPELKCKITSGNSYKVYGCE